MKKLLFLTPLLFLVGCATTDYVGVSSSYGYGTGAYTSSTHVYHSPYSSTRFNHYTSPTISRYGNVYYDPVSRRYITLRPGYNHRVVRPYRPIRPPHYNNNRPIYRPAPPNINRPIQRPRPTPPNTRPDHPRPRPGVSNPRPGNSGPPLNRSPRHGATRERVGHQQER